MHYKISLCILLFPVSLWAQTGELSLTLEQSAGIMNKGNRTLQMADKAVGIARSERQKMNSFWYPSLGASGAYVHLSNNIEVKQSLKGLADPVKEFIHSIMPDDQLISSFLDNIGAQTLTFPLLQRNLTTIDANITWPLFTGGKRIFATRIGNRMVDLARVTKEETGATLQSELVETYYALRLAQRVVEVREQTFNGLQKHYQNALKLEENGMINKAERLFAQVSMDEAKRELESSKKELKVAQNALKALLDVEETTTINPSSPLFMNHDLPDELYFKNLVGTSNYIVSKLRLQEVMADNQLKISKSAYVPTIALFGKQTLYADNLPKNLMPRTLIGIGFTWNIFDGLNREADIRQARLTKQTLQLEREKARNDLGVLVDKLYSEIQNAKDDVAALNTTIDMSRELVRIRKKSFQEGMATSTDVIDAETMLSKVQIAFLLAYYKYDVALASLLSTCGVPESFWQYSRAGQTEDFIFEQ
ncbi:MAG: TolC family protein [Bacteroides sp.]|nr:TolC family protein [Bacteroides sp.]